MRSGRKTTPVLAGLLVGLLSTVVIGNWQHSRPNVVMIVVDSLRADAVSNAAGAPATPNLHALRSEGVNFPLAFSHSSSAVPAHVAMASGRLPHEAHALGSDGDVDRDVTLLPEWLQDYGYQTMAAFSLEELRPSRAGKGLDRGYQLFDGGTEPVDRADSVVKRVGKFLEKIDPGDSFYLFAHLADPHEPYTSYGGFDHQAEVLLDDRPVGRVSTSELHRWEHETTLTPGEHLLEFSSDAGIRLRNFTYDYRDRAMPFDVRVGDFLGQSERIVIVLSNPSDAPIAVSLRAWLNDTPPLLELRQRYEREVEAVDEAVGQIVSMLKWRGLYDDTIVIVTSAHGEALGDHGRIGHDVNLFDEMLHVPLIVRLPESWRERRAQLLENSLGLARHEDLVPTLLELAEIPAWPGLSGSSLLHEADRTLLAETAPPTAPHPLFAMRDCVYKLVYDPQNGGSYSMYRFASDPLELDDVFAHQGHLRREWQTQLRSVATAALAPAAR